MAGAVGLARRVGALEVRPPRSAPAPRSAFDAARLTLAEQVELDDLLRPLAPRPGGRWDLEPLGAAQLERAYALVAKGHGLGEEPG